MSIDDAQLRAKEVEEVVGELVRLVGWLREEANWEWGWRERGWWVERLGGRFPAGAVGLAWELTPPDEEVLCLRVFGRLWCETLKIRGLCVDNLVYRAVPSCPFLMMALCSGSIHELVRIWKDNFGNRDIRIY